MASRPTGFCLDSNAIIHIVENPAPGVDVLMDLAARGVARLVVSELALAEILVKPFQLGDVGLARLYEDLLSPGGIFDVKPVSRVILVASAQNRADFGNKGADAIHVATALSARCNVLVSGDKRIRMPDALQRWDMRQILAWATA